MISFSFTACLERDAQGKQVRRYTPWTPPEELTPSRARKAAERTVDAWENEIKAEYQKEREAGADPTCSPQRNGTMILSALYTKRGPRSKYKGIAEKQRQYPSIPENMKAGSVGP